MKCECGYNEFYAHQRCYHDIKVNEHGDFISNVEIYESENPYGPFRCVNCGKEHEELIEPVKTTHEKIIYVSKEEIEMVNRILNPMRTADKTDEVVETFTANFGDCGEGEVSIDIKLVDSRDGSAYIDPVMFQHGCEVACMDVRDAFKGETFIFSGYLKHTYEVKIREQK